MFTENHVHQNTPNCTIDKKSGEYAIPLNRVQWRSDGNWCPGANLNFAPPPPSKKFLKNDTEMSIQLIMCIIILA